jgi:CPA2 family monovalent cation:H+ antiporter-2
MLSGLELALILLGAATIIVVLLRRFGVPPIIAYLGVGALLGPHAAGFAAESESLEAAAELGVVFLMFSLGLEFKLGKLVAMRRFVLGLGGAQVLTTGLLLMGALLLLPASWAHWLVPGLDWRVALVVGFALAMSSTALVTKLLAERGELESPHGQRAFSVLLFQDLAVIPLLIVVPALAGDTDDLAIDLALALFKAALTLLILLRFGPRLMRRWFSTVARQRSHELFTLNVLLATLLFAWLTRQVGLSMELGAFVAGMMIAETEFRYQVEEDIKPFRDVLLGLFFVTIGMRLDPGVVLSEWPQLVCLVLVTLTIKMGLVVGICRALGDDAPVAVRTGVWLSQTGEFAFVLFAQALGVGVLGHEGAQLLLAAVLLSMVSSPLLLAQVNRLTRLLAGQQDWMQRSLALQQVASRSLIRRGHVILCGFGRCGQSLAHVLESEQVIYVALDTDPDRVREAAGAGEDVVFGDGARREVLLAAGIHRARALVITFDDVSQAIRVLARVRELAPQLPVIVRTSNDAAIDRLREAGATEVVPEIVEGSLTIASHAMGLAGVPAGRIRRRLRSIRAGRYALLQGFFQGSADRDHETIEEEHVHLQAVPIPAGAAALGRTLEAVLALDVRVTALVRGGRRLPDPDAKTVITAGDVLVLAGLPDRLAAAEEWLLAQAAGHGNPAVPGVRE